MFKKSPSFFFLLLYISLIIFNHNFYRYEKLLNIGLNIRVLDAALIMLVIVLFTFFRNPLKISGLKGIPKRVFIIALLYLMVGFIGIFKGYQEVGTYAIGLGRYSFFEFILVPIFLKIINSKKKLIFLLNFVLILTPLILLYYVIVNFESFIQLISFKSKERILSAFNVMVFANWSIFLIPLFFIHGFKEKYFKKIPTKLIIPFNLFGIFIFQHRSVWVSFFISSVILIYFYRKYNFIKNFNKYIFFIIIMFPVLATISNFKSFQSINKTIEKRLIFLDNYEKDPSGYWRIRGWQIVISETFQNTPYFGQNFKSIGWQQKNGARITVWEHNQYIHIFRHLGIVGLSLFLLLIYTIIKTVLVTINSILSEDLIIILLAELASFFFVIIFMLFYNQPVFFWLNIALICSTIKIANMDLQYD